MRSPDPRRGRPRVRRRGPRPRRPRPPTPGRRSSRSAASPTRRGSSPPSAPAPTPSGSTSPPARRASCRSRRASSSRASPARRRPRGRPAPQVVLVTADLPADAPAAGRRRRRPRRDPAQRRRAAVRARRPSAGRPGRRCGCGAADDPDAVVAARPRLPRRRRDADPARRRRRAAPGRHRRCASTPALAAAVAREVPITLAGGLHPGNVAEALLAIPAIGVDVASRHRRARASTGERPRKDPLRVALFTKRARDARRHRPNVAVRPDARPRRPARGRTARGRWGMERDFGGRYVPETLVARARAARGRVRRASATTRGSGPSSTTCSPATPAARPPLYRADRLAAGRAASRRRCRSGDRRPAGSPTDPGDPALPQARGPRPHRRPQDQQRARPGAAHPAARQDAGHRRDRRGPARRRDGDRVRAARPAVRRVHGRGGHPAPGAERAPDARARRGGPLGHVRHGHAQGRRQRGDARLGHQRRDDALRARVGDGAAPVPHDRPRPPAPDRRRGGGAAARRRGPAARTSPSPASAAARTRSGCSSRFIGEPSVRLAVAEAAGDGVETGRHAAAIAGGTPGILHGSRSLMLQDRDGQVVEAHSRVGRPRLPGRRAAARGARRGRPARGRDRDGPRGRRGDAGGDPHRGHPAGARDRARDRRAAQAAGRPRGLGRAACPTTPFVLLGFSGRGDKDLAALERFADVEPWDLDR